MTELQMPSNQKLKYSLIEYSGNYAPSIFLTAFRIWGGSVFLSFSFRKAKLNFK